MAVTEELFRLTSNSISYDTHGSDSVTTTRGYLKIGNGTYIRDQEVGVTNPGIYPVGYGSLLQPAKLCLYNRKNSITSEKQFIIQMGTKLTIGSGNVDASIWPQGRDTVSKGQVFLGDDEILRVRTT